MHDSNHSPPEQPNGSERRRFERQSRRLSVSFTLDGQDYGAQTVDVSKTGALFSSQEAPSVGTQLLLSLSDRENPDLTLFLKATVVRDVGERAGMKLFAAEFGDIIARDPKRLRLFLERVLGISSGLIRVVGGYEGEEKAYAFSFDPVHREGEERVKALQASLFSSIEEMEEADAILDNFGRMPVEDGLEGASGGGAADVMLTRVGGGEQETPGAGAESGEVQGEQTAGKKRKRKKKKKKKKPKEKKGGSFFVKLAGFFGGRGGGKKKAPTRGETLIQTQRLPTVVVKDKQLPVVYRMGSTRYQATATRLYCAGMKCVTGQQLPQLYASVTILIPLAGAKKISQIELVGDVTRVRGQDDDGGSGGVFEIRLSMRTDKMQIELYRALLERLISKEQGSGEGV